MIANIFGIGSDLDVFFASNTLNVVLVGVSLSAINFALTPLLVKHYKASEFRKLRELSNSVFNSFLVIFLLISVLQLLLAKTLVGWLLPGFSGEQKVLTVFFFKFQAFLSVIVVLTGVLTALHYTLKRYYRTILVPALSQLVYLGFVFWGHSQLGLYSLVYGLAISQVFTFVLLGISFLRHYRPKILFNQEFGDAVRKIYPLMLAGAFGRSNLIIDRFFASALEGGSITILQYGNKIIEMISGFLNRGVSIVTLRSFSMMEHDNARLKNESFIAYKAILFFVILFLVGIIFFLRDFLGMVALTKQFTSKDVLEIYLVALSLLGVLIGGSLSGVVVNVFYSKGLTSIVSKVDAVAQVFGIGLKIAMFYVIGFWGLPLAFSIQSLGMTLILLLLLHKNVYSVEFMALIKYAAKLMLLGLLAVTLPKLLFVLYLESFAGLILAGGLFFLLFFAVTYVDKNEICRAIVSRLYARLSEPAKAI